MYLVSKEYHFSAAHRLQGHPKCGKMHGHNYKVVFVLGSWHLHDGMVIDFGDLNKLVKPIIDELDHQYLLSSGQKAVKGLEREETFPMKIPYTTAECLAKWLALALEVTLPAQVSVEEVQVWETPKAVGIYRVPQKSVLKEEYATGRTPGS